MWLCVQQFNKSDLVSKMSFVIIYLLVLAMVKLVSSLPLVLVCLHNLFVVYGTKLKSTTKSTKYLCESH